MLNGRKSPIIQGNECRVLCEATVDLISKVFRPYLFRVTVTGKPPHEATRVYEIYGKSDDEAAMAGIRQFEKDMLHPKSILKLL
jgi:hypothetical protein